MKSAVKFLSGAAALALAATAQGQIISSNLNWTTGYFNQGDGYDQFASLDGAPTNAPASEQWQTTDPFNGSTGSTSIMDFTPGWTFGTNTDGNMSVVFGGYDLNGGVIPGITNPVLYREFTPFTGGTNISTIWSADFGIVDYNNPFYASLDSFSFDLQDSVGTSLAKFVFNPATATSQDLRLEWYQNGSLQISNNFEIQYGALYRITATLYDSSFDLSIAGLNAQTNSFGTVTNYAIVTNVSVLTGAGLSSPFTRADFATAAMGWELTSGDTNNPGSQALLVNTMSVNDVYTVVPEAETWMAGLALLAITGLVVWKRKAASIGAQP
jgi:hypothetical protein